MTPDTGRLDSAVVILLLLILGGILFVLAFHEIPEKNMTLFAALASGVVGSSVGAYVGFRWGSSRNAEKTAEKLVGP